MFKYFVIVDVNTNTPHFVTKDRTLMEDTLFLWHSSSLSGCWDDRKYRTKQDMFREYPATRQLLGV